MPTSKPRKKINRKDGGKKLYRMVHFESDLFDAPFTFPDQQHMTVGLVEAVNAGDMGELTKWLAKAKVQPEEIEALRELEGEEVEQFMREWGNGSIIDLPKSSD